LSALDVRQVAMESTGVYWRPVYTLLEEECSSVLVNPQHLKRVPGHKTDVKDAEWLAEWLADLLRHGLLQASFIPPQPVRDVRELTRYRKTLVQERAQEVLRVQKVLESANVKLACVATDVLGKSGRAMLEALVGGEQDPEALAALARGRLRAKLPELWLALEGRVRPVHLVQLRLLLEHITFLESVLAELQQEIERLLVPFADAVALAQTIPGVAQTAAIALIAASALIAPDGHR
jgi:transposase